MTVIFLSSPLALIGLSTSLSGATQWPSSDSQLLDMSSPACIQCIQHEHEPYKPTNLPGLTQGSPSGSVSYLLTSLNRQALWGWDGHLPDSLNIWLCLYCKIDSRWEQDQDLVPTVYRYRIPSAALICTTASTGQVLALARMSFLQALVGGYLALWKKRALSSLFFILLLWLILFMYTHVMKLHCMMSEI